MSDVTRFKEAQKRDFETALSEIESGRKRSHWMWYIFPQMKGLGRTSTADYYGISDMAEARAYLADAYLSENLRKITRALTGLSESNPTRVMGRPDDLKLRSSMTLFYLAAENDADKALFKAVIDKFYNGEFDARTGRLLS